MSEYWNKFKTSWLDKIEPDTINWAKDFGELLSSQVNNQRDTELTTNQLRKFFGEIKRQQIKGFLMDDFILLRPKLAYAVAKKGKRNARINDFYNVFSHMIGAVKNEKQFSNFIKIFEAVVAYHTASEIINV